MTTIACNQNMMAADRLCAYGSMPTPCIKLFKTKYSIVGTAGDSGEGLRFVEWFQEYEETNELPDRPDGLKEFECIVLNKEGIYVYDGSFIADKIYEPYFAIGSGQSFAIAAMDYGDTPVQAVQYAATRDVYTSSDYDVIRLTDL